MQVIFILSLFVLFSFFLFEPTVVFQSAGNAITLWAETIVPSMLPFFILNNVLFAAGGIHLLGSVLSRPIQKILGLPGDAAFILATGYSTGVPVSASLIAKLRKENRLSREQGNCLLAYSSNVSPAFILSAVAVSMLDTEAAGPFLAAVHYGSNAMLMLACSLFFRFQKKQGDELPSTPPKEKAKALSVQMVIDALFTSIRTIFLIGGIIVIFFILIAFFDTVGLFHRLSQILGLSTQQKIALHAISCGFLEITAGTQKASLLSLSFPLKTAILSAVLSFGGLSALMQIVSQIQGTDLSIRFYLRYKIIQGVLAFTISLLFPFQAKEAFASFHFAQTTSLVFHAPTGYVLYGIAVFSAIILLIHHFCCAEKKMRR